MWESRVLRRAFERLELHEWKHSRAVLRGGGGGDVTSLPDLQGVIPGATRPFSSPRISAAPPHGGHVQPGILSQPLLQRVSQGGGTRLQAAQHNEHGSNCDAPTCGASLAASGWAERETGLAWIGSMGSLHF